MLDFNYNEIGKRAMAPNLLKSYGVDIEKAEAKKAITTSNTPGKEFVEKGNPDFSAMIHTHSKEIATHAGINHEEYRRLHPGTKTELAHNYHKDSVQKATGDETNADHLKNYDNIFASADEGTQGKMHKVMHEFKEGSLKTSAGDKVTKRSQALAIAISEAKSLSKSEEAFKILGVNV